MTETTEQSPLSRELARLASDRDWNGYLTLENLEAVAARFRSLLDGQRYTWVACNSGLRHYFPEVRTGQQLRDRGITTYRDEEAQYGPFGGITVPDTYGVWGLHTDCPGQRTARRRRVHAWERASDEQKRTDTWDDQHLTYLHITRDKVEIEHYAPIGYRLYWVVTVEPRDAAVAAERQRVSDGLHIIAGRYKNAGVFAQCVVSDVRKVIQQES
jgi:hypothetical protein